MADQIPPHHLAVILDDSKKGKAKCKATISKQNGTTFNLNLQITDFKVKIDKNATNEPENPLPGKSYGAFKNNQDDDIVTNTEIDFDCTFTYGADEEVVYLVFQTGAAIKTDGTKVRSGS
jgi:hypothetical protein